MQTGMSRSISLKCRDDGLPTHVAADSNPLSQIFINVLTNAYEAVDQHKREIFVSAEVASLG
jgi:signal transduction histidine kinase